MKKSSLMIVLFLASLCALAENNNPFIDIFKEYFPNNVRLSMIKSFVGDTIMIDVPPELSLSNIIMEKPDTVWIKDKMSKKPKEGKDYLLCYNYKGVRYDKTFFTPAKEFRNKPFGFLAVEEIMGGKHSSECIGYVLTLVEPETSNVLRVTLDKDMESVWRVHSLKADREIEGLKKQHFYRKNPKNDGIVDYRLSNGTLFLSMTSGHFRGTGTKCVFMNGLSEFVLESESETPLTLKYDVISGITSSQGALKFLSQDDYEKYLEEKRIYKIDTSYPTDIIYEDKIRHLPFDFIIGVVRNRAGGALNNYVSQDIVPGTSPLGRSISIPDGTAICIVDRITVRGKTYYKAVWQGKPFFIESFYVHLNDSSLCDLTTLLSESKEVRDAFMDKAKISSRQLYHYERKEELEAFTAMMKRDLAVLDARAYDMSEYTDGTGIRFRICNTSKKTIKYITINCIGYNAVDDPVASRRGTVISRKGIGPIEPYETATYDFEYVWFTDAVEYLKVRSIVVQYTNGTSKTFTGNAVKIVPDNVFDAPQYKSPIATFLPTFDEDNN